MQHRRRHRRCCPTTRSTSCSCAPRRRPTPICCARARRRASRLRSSPAPATARQARTVAGPRQSSSPSPTSSASCSPGRTGRASSARRPTCARRSLRPYPPAGRIGVASQSGNFVSSFLNYARATGRRHQPRRVGGQRGGGRRRRLPRVLRRRRRDRGRPRLRRGHRRRTRAAATASAASPPRKPLVIVKGGATEGGAAAAASHTGALAANDKVFDGACRAAGVTRAATVEEAFEAAATFATQPLPKGPNVVVLTTAGGWGVVTSDAIHRDGRAAAAAAAGRPRAADRHQAPAALEPEQPGRLRRRRDA